MSRRVRLFLSLALVLCAAPAARAQKKDKKKDPAAAAAPTPEQQQAVVEFTKGQELEKAGDLDGAIAQYEKAFAIYPDPELQFLLGESYRKKGDQTEDFALYERAIPYYKKYLEMAPEGRAAEPARQRIAALEQGIARNKENLAKQAEEERAAAAAKAEAEAKVQRAKQAEHEGTQVALDVHLLAGTEPDLTGIARLGAGGLLGWGNFAFEGHIGFGGFLQISGDSGVAAREFTLLDLGARYAFTSDRFVGPFVGLGGSFGLITGKPRERKLDNDAATCGRFEGNDCTFSVDKDLSGRLALGYGIASSPKTTVAIRVDLTYFLFSVDGEQGLGAPPAAQVEKPQGLMAVVFGLELTHWP